MFDNAAYNMNFILTSTHNPNWCRNFLITHPVT